MEYMHWNLIILYSKKQMQFGVVNIMLDDVDDGKSTFKTKYIKQTKQNRRKKKRYSVDELKRKYVQFTYK